MVCDGQLVEEEEVSPPTRSSISPDGGAQTGLEGEKAREEKTLEDNFSCHKGVSKEIWVLE